MAIDALIMSPEDNVATCVRDVKKGEAVVYRKGGELCQVEAKEDIPYCHKIALEPMEKDAVVRKYGEMIGKTTMPIEKGCWVSHENIYSVLRDYDSEMI